MSLTRPQKMLGFVMDACYYGYDLVSDFQYHSRRYKVHMFYVFVKTAYENPRSMAFFMLVMLRALYVLYRRSEIAARVMHSVAAFLLG